MNDDFDISLSIFLHFSLLSLMAVGGGVLAVAPDMLRFVSETNAWVSARTFVECFTLAQIAPGPNFLFATLVGMQAAGPLGALAATLALVVPPALLAALILHFGAKIGLGSWGATLRTAILPLSIGMVGATAWTMGVMTVHSLAQGALFAACLAVLTLTRLNPLWLILAGAGAGVAGLV